MDGLDPAVTQATHLCLSPDIWGIAEDLCTPQQGKAGGSTMQGYRIDSGIAVPVVVFDPADRVIGYGIPAAGTYERKCVKAKP
jgi:hypothetical protein